MSFQEDQIAFNEAVTDLLGRIDDRLAVADEVQAELARISGEFAEYRTAEDAEDVVQNEEAAAFKASVQDLTRQLEEQVALNNEAQAGLRAATEQVRSAFNSAPVPGPGDEPAAPAPDAPAPDAPVVDAPADGGVESPAEDAPADVPAGPAVEGDAAEDAPADSEVADEPVATDDAAVDAPADSEVADDSAASEDAPATDEDTPPAGPSFV